MEKIKMTTPLVEMDGDEMTRILWQIIKDELLLPFVDLKTEYYDLGLPKREETRDQITIDAANANKKYGVAVKCATITPNKQRVEEYNLTEMWKSPNGTIRAILDGTVFRSPILIDSIRPVVRNWKKPITIARHAYGDVYKCTEYRVPAEGKAELVFTDAEGKETFRKTIYDFECPGVLQGSYNKDSSIRSFAHSCFQYAIDTKQELWFSTKDTISKQYDQTFKLIFQEIYDECYKEKFEELGIRYFYTLIDDAVARVIRKAAVTMLDENVQEVSVTSAVLKKYLGAVRYVREMPEKQPRIGVVNGLAWTESGGDILEVEVNVMDGSGKLELTGNLGDVMKESVQAALSCLRTRTEVLGIEHEFYKNKDIHVHFPEGAVPKDGPSAGIAIATALTSALTGRKVRAGIAMTGEITLRGRVLPIGGLKEKTMAALRNGIQTVIIPADNVRDLEEIDQTVRAALRFVPVREVDQVLTEALMPLPAAKPAREEQEQPLAAFAPLVRENNESAALRQ